MTLSVKEDTINKAKCLLRLGFEWNYYSYSKFVIFLRLHLSHLFSLYFLLSLLHSIVERGIGKGEG